MFHTFSTSFHQVTGIFSLVLVFVMASTCLRTSVSISKFPFFLLYFKDYAKKNIFQQRRVADAHFIQLPYFLFCDAGMDVGHGLKYCCYPNCQSESKDKRIQHGQHRSLSLEHHKTNFIFFSRRSF